ncbi:MAG: mechanosensitive ion channel family protein, partial [Myxococcales bacterium]|nr:mechanosensitive ion channel family protein [Myxococcales bacterium]
IYGFLVTILIVYVVARLYGELLNHFLRPIVQDTDTKLDDQLLPLAVKGGRFIIWSIGLMVALDNAGIDVTSMVAGLGIGGLALAMAAKDTISNVFGGASIFADRPFEIGDLITVSGTTGTVFEIGVRTTRIRTFDDTVFIIPNSSVANSSIENHSERRKRKRTIDLGLTYDTSYDRIQEAKAIVASILEEAGGIEENPTIRLDTFGDFALVLKVVYWVLDVDEFWGKVALINEQILKRFAEAGLEFAFPTQTLYLNKTAA